AERSSRSMTSTVEPAWAPRRARGRELGDLEDIGRWLDSRALGVLRRNSPSTWSVARTKWASGRKSVSQPLTTFEEAEIMTICITFGGVRHCWNIPIYQIPIKIPKPGPVNYPAFLMDATLIASINDLTGQVSDKRVKAALQAGVKQSVVALKE